MKKRFTSLALFLLLLSPAIAEDYSSCFFPGEVSEYKVSWMGVPLAWSRTTTEEFTENGRNLIRIQVVSKSYKAFAKVYNVDDTKEVIIDPKTALPLRLDLELNEGNIHTSQQTHFDHINHTAQFIDRNANTTNHVEIADQTREIITFLFAMRNEKMADIEATTHTLFSGGQLYEMDIEIKKKGRVKLSDYGKIGCVKLEPLAEFDGLFLRKGKIMFWISQQKRRMITCIKAQVPVGKITVKLQSVTGPGNDIWVKKELDEN